MLPFITERKYKKKTIRQRDSVPYLLYFPLSFSLVDYHLERSSNDFDIDRPPFRDQLDEFHLPTALLF